MLGVGAPQIGTRPRAEVGLVALGLVDPPPAQVLLKVDVERAQAAVVLDVSRGRQDGREDDLLTGEGQQVPLVPRKTDEQTNTDESEGLRRTESLADRQVPGAVGRIQGPLGSVVLVLELGLQPVGRHQHEQQVRSSSAEAPPLQQLQVAGVDEAVVDA